jgi:hypothetical protein
VDFQKGGGGGKNTMWVKGLRLNVISDEIIIFFKGSQILIDLEVFVVVDGGVGAGAIYVLTNNVVS